VKYFIPLYHLDPIAGTLRGRIYADHLYEHDWTKCPRRRERGPATGRRLFMVLLALADFSGARDDRSTHILTEQRELARKIDDLHRRGASWPMLPTHPGSADTGWYPFTPAARGVSRPRSRRPERGYCVRWTGAFWAPCMGVKGRREAGYIGLMMCWPPPIPKTGAYLSSGPRARFWYRVCEVERFRPPRGAKRFTCRLWCERVDPMLVPKRATIVPFYWHPRESGRRPAA
jgi:hypothetical protein